MAGNISLILKTIDAPTIGEEFARTITAMRILSRLPLHDEAILDKYHTIDDSPPILKANCYFIKVEYGKANWQRNFWLLFVGWIGTSEFYWPNNILKEANF